MVDVGDPASDGGVRGAGERLCAQLVDQLSITGASISVMGRSGQSTVGASDEVAMQLERLQFELGEGPHWEAFHTSMPVLVPNLGDADHSHWPVFGSAASATGAAALFTIPIIMGAATVGVVDMYRATGGALAPVDVDKALSLAAMVGHSAMRLATAQRHRQAADDLMPGMRREVHQATGMVLVQLGINATEAFARLQSYAFAQTRSLEYVAHEVVSRRLDFREEADGEDR